jgi:hypothetical protein
MDCRGKSSIELEEGSFHQQNGFKLKEETSRECNIWTVTLCGTETWTLLKVDQKYFEVLKSIVGKG